MLSSMTGFGRAVAEALLGKLTVEIQSVNRKYLEVAVSLPKEFSRIEPEVRKWAVDGISRGQISVRVFLTPNIETLDAFLPAIDVLKRLKKAFEKVSSELGTDPKAIDLPFLMQHVPSQQNRDLATKEDVEVLQSCLKEALQNLLSMKKAEGKALSKDLAEKLQTLRSLIEEVAKQAPDSTKKMRQKLTEKMEEVLKPGLELEERLLREVALFAERVDITEEIIRFRSHLDQFKQVLKGDVVGRKMEFLLQEMGREVNTIGSKSVDILITKLILEMKSELEKMREQIQNLE